MAIGRDHRKADKYNPDGTYWYLDQEEYDELHALWRSVGPVGHFSFESSYPKPRLREGFMEEPVRRLIISILSEDPLFKNELPFNDVTSMDILQVREYRAFLNARIRLRDDPAHIGQYLNVALLALVEPLLNEVAAVAGPSPFSVPLYDVLDHVRLTAQNMYYNIFKRGRSHGIFRRVCAQIEHNSHRWLEIPIGTENKPFKGIPYCEAAHTWLPATYEQPNDEFVEHSFHETPFLEFFRTPVPIPLRERFDHHFICAGSGGGKTSVIEHMLLHDINDPAQPSIVLIDPSSDVIKRLINANLGVDHRLTYITPTDIEHPPAVNVFAPSNREYDTVTREQVSASVIDTFEYLFSGLFDLELTGRQQTVFRYIARLMLAFPAVKGRNATLKDMLDVTESTAPFADVIATLPPVQREFFERDYIPKFKDTRTQMQYRLQAIIGEPMLGRLFTSPTTKIDLFDRLNRGSIILIDTAQSFLGSGSSIYGRLWISLVLQAILERSALPESQRRPTYLYIDEALTYFDDKMASLLRDVRKYKCGAILASQELPADKGIRSSLSANTGIKMACRTSAADAGALAPDMRTTKEYLLAQPKLRFATYMQGMKEPISIPIEPGALAKLPQRDPSSFLYMNRMRVSGGYPEPEPAAYAEAAEEGAPPPRAPQGDDDGW